ncbi:MAG: hypothetical protein M1830_004025 [Pleopsidium flavum]|nr:MAG: hypothetical protein M1830_004025 [Pleopsidium flavum]
MQFKHLSLAALAATASAQNMNLTSVLTSNPDLSNLTSYVSLYPQMLMQLSNATNITILAPSNEAFNKFMNSSMGAAVKANDTALIQSVLMYHVLNGTHNSSSIMNTTSFIPTMLNNPMFANVTGGQRVEALMTGKNVTFFSGLLANSTVTKADMTFTGGVIHVIDNVLTVPQNISATAVAANLTSLAGALMNAKLVETLDTARDVTVFAPNNAAFQAIGSALPNMTTEELTRILEYHVCNGTVEYSSMLKNNTMLKTMNGDNLTVTMVNGTTFVNSAKVVMPDVLVANGVVHVIDNVLNPNMTMATPNPTASSQSAAFSGASSASNVPYTSGVATPTSVIMGGAGAAQSSAAGGAAKSSSKSGAAMPMRTGAIGAAALFAAGGAFINV